MNIDASVDTPKKQISFIGKHAIDTIDKITTKKIAKRNEMKDIDDEVIEYSKQVGMINALYMNELITSNDVERLLKCELEKKINGYKNQDIRKNIYNELLLISLNETVEKLVSSKLKCFYCNKNLLILYKNVRDSEQWTLDRIDNDNCHSNENTVISCLKCNLQRRTQCMDKFLFTKKLNITKIE